MFQQPFLELLLSPYAQGSPDEIEQAKRIADCTHPASWVGLAEAAVYYDCTD